MADIADANDPDRYAYLAEGNARQARKRVATNVIIGDDTDRVLLVNPTYKPHWDIPGGMAEANEPPRTAAARELHEELNLTVDIGRLLLVAWVGPQDPWDDQLVFVFDGGTLTPSQTASLKISDTELSDYRFTTPDEATNLLRPDITLRLQRALTAQASGGIDYVERQYWTGTRARGMRSG